MTAAVGQTSKGRTNSGTSISTTAVNTSATGSTFILLTCCTQNTTLSTPTDSYGNTYVGLTTETTIGGAGNDNARLWICANAIGGVNHTFSHAVGSPGTLGIAMVELTDCVLSGSSDGTNQADDGTSPFASGTAATSQAITMLISAIVNNSGSNPANNSPDSSASPTSGWTEQTGCEETDGSIYFSMSMMTQRVTSTGTYGGAWTAGGATAAAVHFAAIKELLGPTITDEPDNVTSYTGSTAQFSVTATGNGTLTYQWQKDTGSGYSDIGSATSSTYTTPELGYSDDLDVFRCNVTDSDGTTASNGALLRVLGASRGGWFRA